MCMLPPVMTQADSPRARRATPQVRRAIVGLGVTQIIGWGSVYYAIGIIGPIVAEAIGVSRDFIYAGYSFSLVVGALAAPRIGALIDSHGGRRMMSAGSLVAAGGLLLAGLASGPLSYLVSCLVLGFASGMTLYDPAFASLAQIAGRDSRRAITLLTLWGGFASTVSWPLTSWLAEHAGWRETYFIYAAANLLICLPIHWTILADAPDQHLFESKAETKPADKLHLDGDLQGAPRRAAFWLFVLVLTANSYVFSGMSVHFIPALGELGVDRATAVAVGMAIGPSQVLGRILEISFGGRFSSVAVGRVSAFLLPVGVCCFLAAMFTPLAAFAYAASYGMANGLITIAKGAIPLALFGSRGYGATLGALTLPSQTARASAPVVFSFLLTSGGATVMLLVALAVALIGFAAMEAMALIHRRSRLTS